MLGCCVTFEYGSSSRISPPTRPRVSCFGFRVSGFRFRGFGFGVLASGVWVSRYLLGDMVTGVPSPMARPPLMSTCTTSLGVYKGYHRDVVQGYLAHKKTQPRRTLPLAYASMARPPLMSTCTRSLW